MHAYDLYDVALIVITVLCVFLLAVLCFACRELLLIGSEQRRIEQLRSKLVDKRRKREEK